MFVTKALERLDKRINATIDIAMGDDAPPLGPAGRVFGGAASLARGVPVAGPVVAAAKKLITFAEEKRDYEMCKRVYQFFPEYRDNTDHWRELFVTVLTEYGLSYNVIFCVLLEDPTDGAEKAMHKMAKDVVSRIFNHLEIESKIVALDSQLMRKAILEGKSETKITEKMKPGKCFGGGRIKTRQKTYKTGSLQSKCDVVFLEEQQVAKKSDSPNKYLYRYSFHGEEVPENAIPRAKYSLDERDQFKNLCSRKSEIIHQMIKKTRSETHREKEMTEEERGESGQDDQDDKVAEISLAGAIRDEKVEGLSKKAENGDANCETERDNKGKTAPSEEMARRNKIGSGIEDKREIEKEPQVQPIQVHVEVCIIL